MHLKLGQMPDVRALFDDEKKILKIPIFDVDTAIRKFSKFPHYLPIFDLNSSELLKYYIKTPVNKSSRYYGS